MEQMKLSTKSTNITSVFISTITLLISFATFTSSAQAARCGGVNQRPCKVWERVPACNLGLLHSFKRKRCVKIKIKLKKKPRPRHCGRLNQKPCKVFEFIPSCSKGLGHDFKLKRCVRLRKGQSALFYGISSASKQVANLEKVCNSVVNKLPRLKTGIAAFDNAATCQIQYQAGYRCAAPMLFTKITKSSNLAGRIDAALNTPRCRKLKGPLKTFCAIGNVIDQAAIRPTVCLAKVMAKGGFKDVAAGSSQALGSMCRAAGRLTFEITVDRLLRRKNNLKGYKRTLFKAAKKARRYSKKGAKIERFFEKINNEPACRGVLN